MIPDYDYGVQVSYKLHIFSQYQIPTMSLIQKTVNIFTFKFKY